MPAAGFIHIANALRNRDFAIFISGHLANQTGMWMARITVGWLTWELTRSETWLGLMGLADLSSSLFVGPLSGALADRVSRLSIMRITQVTSTIIAAVTYVTVAGGAITPVLLFFLVLMLGISMSTNVPARVAIVPNLVKRENMNSAVALTSLCGNAGRFLGPALGGFIIFYWDISVAFGVCALLFGVPIFTLWLVRPPPIESKRSGKHLLTDAIEGITYSARHVGIGSVMVSLIATAVFGKTLVYLFPAFASDVFGRGADALAWLTGSVGLGAVMGGFFLARRHGVQGLTRIYVFSLAVLGICLFVFPMNSTFWLALPIAAVFGASMLINGVAAQTLFQYAVDGDKRGRISSLFTMIQRGGQSLGSLVLGVTADLIGLRWAVIAAGAICLCFWLWSSRRARTMAQALET